MSSAARRLNAAAMHAADVGTLAPATMRVASTYFLSPGGTGKSASSGNLGHDVVGFVRLCEAWVALQVRQLRPDHDIVGVLLEPLLEALDVVQPFGWDWHAHSSSSFTSSAHDGPRPAGRFPTGASQSFQLESWHIPSRPDQGC